MKNNPLFTLFLLLLPVFSCKTATQPVAHCDPGYLPCEDDITTCCEVICPDLYHNCGGQLTDCCLDSTSHSFSWSIDTLGIYGSYLNDVAIVNEDDIWVVGALTIDDSTLQYQGETNYNGAHWNGSEWEYLKIYNPHLELYSILYFSENDIWVTTFGFPIHWDGNEWTLYHLQNMGLNVSAGFASWGTSSSDMYFVGYQGSIVHYDGANFVQMESGTDVDLKDIAGTPDGEHVFAVGREHISTAPSVALEFSDGSWSTLYYTEGTQPHDGNMGWIYGVDVLEDTVYFSTTNSLWKYNYLAAQSVIVPDSTSHFGEGAFKRIIIHSLNDVFFGGAGFKYIHFNGADYHYSHEITDMYSQRAMYGTDYNGELVVMVGFCCSYGHALVIKGFHN